MVPIYALNAWLGLIFPEKSIYMDSIRECYEAYCIYNFLKYLLNYLNLEMDLEANLELKPQVKHFFPFCCLRAWEMGADFIFYCKQGVLQYVVLRPIITFISVICEFNGVYGEGSFETNVAFPYITAINNVSQAVAMYCLVLFYKANYQELKPMRPLPKFLCIKAVVFFSFFQGFIINILVYYGVIKNIFGSQENEDYKVLSSKLQDFLICVEMFLAAIAHKYSFPHKPYHLNVPYYMDTRSGNWFSRFAAMWDISDVQQDVSEHFGVVSSSVSRRLRGRTMYQQIQQGRRDAAENEYLVVQGTGRKISTSKPPSESGKSMGYGAFCSTDQHQQQINEMKKSKDSLSSSQEAAGSSGSAKTLKTTAVKSDKEKTNTDSSSTIDLMQTIVDEVAGIEIQGLGNDHINLHSSTDA
jgi:Organic solute transporter Ostalpha